MLVASLGYMPLPLFIWAGARHMSLFLFVALWQAATLPIYAVFRQVQRNRQIGKDTKWIANQTSSDEAPPAWARVALTSDLIQIKPKYLAWGVVFGGTNWLLFALALTLVDPIVATLINESWPVLFAIATLTAYWRKRMLNGKNEGGSISSMLALLAIGGLGCALAVASEAGTLAWAQVISVGMIVAVLAALVTALSIVVNQLMGKDRRDLLDLPFPIKVSGDSNEDEIRNRTAVSMAAHVANKSLSAPFVAMVGVVHVFANSSNWWSVSGGLFLPLCVVCELLAAWAAQQANHLARDAHKETAAKVNAIYYVAPIGAMLALWVFADTTIKRPDLLILGTAIVLGANIAFALRRKK